MDFVEFFTEGGPVFFLRGVTTDGREIATAGDAVFDKIDVVVGVFFDLLLGEGGGGGGEEKEGKAEE